MYRNNYPKTVIEYQIRILDFKEIFDGYDILKNDYGYYFKCNDEVFLNYISSHLEIINANDSDNLIEWDKNVLVNENNSQYKLENMEFKLCENKYIDDLFNNRLNWKFDHIIKKETIDTIVVVFELYKPYCLPHIGFCFKRNGVFLKNDDLFNESDKDEADRDWYNKNHTVKILQDNETELSLFLNSLD